MTSSPVDAAAAGQLSPSSTSSDVQWNEMDAQENENILVLPDEEISATLHLFAEMDPDSSLNAREQQLVQREEYVEQQIESIDRLSQSLAAKHRRLLAWEKDLRRREEMLKGSSLPGLPGQAFS
ncbi:hypothetical protein PRZ48_008960 [Zasmidium cellare]|uniref:Uncharacterized protein n=1 Tax=Zasmidium cellare TaxID=395010 RepID=A0ABR0EHM3_ZASCE|nr:hypothetical protein PRZ48_008960 [Zasmidium cellare]